MKAIIWLLALAALFVLSGCASEPKVIPPTDQLVPNVPAPASPAPEMKVAATEPDPDGVTLVAVGFGMNNQYISVAYKAPPAISDQWLPQSGDVYVIDEKTGVTYKDVPMVPVIGPLFERPKNENQLAYVMLVNPSFNIKSGSVLTVVLGNYKREHYTVP